MARDRKNGIETRVRHAQKKLNRTHVSKFRYRSELISFRSNVVRDYMKRFQGRHPATLTTDERLLLQAMCRTAIQAMREHLHDKVFRDDTVMASWVFRTCEYYILQSEKQATAPLLGTMMEEEA